MIQLLQKFKASKMEKDLKQELKKLQEEYDQLQAKHNKLNSRLYAILRMNDRTMKTFFNKSLKADVLSKRFYKILKQGDKQSKHWLVENDKKDELIIQQSKLAMMGEMIENITHQMKQPLSLITTASTAMELKKEMNKLSDEEFELFTKKILDATKYLNDTISNFRNFFHQNKKIQKIFVHNVIEKSKQLLETKLKGKNIQIIYLPSKELYLYGLENDLIQITTNLLSNSIDALENIDENKRLIIIQAFETDEMLQLEFQDSGGGIPQEHLNNIFTLYFTTKSQEKGSGVGLHMCKTIIENNFHGNIHVSNKYFIYDDYKYYGANFVLNFKKQ